MPKTVKLVKEEPDDNEADETVDDPMRFIADRADIWRAALGLLKGQGVDGYEPQDIVSLAEFLGGDHVR